MSLLDRLTEYISSKTAEDLVSSIPSEGIVKQVLDSGKIVFKHVSSPSEMIDTELGPLTGGKYGLFIKPEEGSKVLLTRVHPGVTNHTQAIKIITDPAQQEHDHFGEPLLDSKYGDLKDGNYEITPGEVLIRSIQAGSLKLFKRGDNGSSISLSDYTSSGLYLESAFQDTKLSLISDELNAISSAGRTFSGRLLKRDLGFTKEISHLYSANIDPYNENSIMMGIYGSSAENYAIFGRPRNPILTFSKKIINHVADSAKFFGLERERELLKAKNISQFISEVEKALYNKTRSEQNFLLLAPDQLLEFSAGNITNNAGELLNINYVNNLNSFKKPKDYFKISESADFNLARDIYNRSIAAHFQLNANKEVSDYFDLSKNFRVVLDKEGVLKLNIPKSSDFGNILYPDSTKISNTNYLLHNSYSNISKAEKIPITLRNSDGAAVFPQISSTMLNRTLRSTGIEFSNTNSYFQNNNLDAVRVNLTKYHNMYAVCELLTANYIEEIFIPQLASFDIAQHIVVGNIYEKLFERWGSDYKSSISRPGNKEFHSDVVATALISPAEPVINPGGVTYVSGQLKRSTPYSNSSADTSNPRYSSVSANINFEGSIESSVGADSADGKSITLDTKGAVVAWLGKDNRGRSLALQTDGDVMVNIGGHDSSGKFNKGRLDLRVNLTNKGTLDDLEKPSDYKDGDSDFIISISEKGFIISGMKKDVPMVINNSGKICIQSPAGIELNGGYAGVFVKEKGLAARPTYMSPEMRNTNSVVNPEEQVDIETLQSLLNNLSQSLEALKKTTEK